ncbi:t-SNARE [Dipodascopsis tothii]|uniref:t-SNARE n=1 Tax=Dipodascopsis tothii TaxID=44089 RepID=UPI0034CED9AD
MSYEMSNLMPGNGAYDNYSRSSALDVRYRELLSMQFTAYDDLRLFLKAVDWIKVGIADLEGTIARIETAQSRALKEVETFVDDEVEDRENALELMREQARSLSRMLIERTRYLESVSHQDSDKRTQIELVKRMLQDTLATYREREAELRKDYRRNIERQVRVVKPDATPDEIDEAIEYSGGQIFAHAMMNVSRAGEARSILSNVMQRQREIRQIEHTMRDLADMTAALAEMVEAQGEDMRAAVGNMDDVEKNMLTGINQLQVARTHAVRARKMKWWGLLITLVIVLIIVLVVLKATNII